MKATFFSGLIASFASLAIASPAAEPKTQLEARDPVICIACVNDSCYRDDPPGCLAEGQSTCNSYCQWNNLEAACQCCDVENGVTVSCTLE